MIAILQNGITADIVVELFAFMLAIIFCMIIHEYAHARVAYSQGDDTAMKSGRMTLNPLAHIDPMGFLTLLLFGFGWAKPVPIDPDNFKSYKKGLFLTSIAGVVTNYFAAFFCCGVFVFLGKITATMEQQTFIYFFIKFLQSVAMYAMIINVNLSIFNIIPIAPLDGFNVLSALLKPENRFLRFVEKYSVILSITLLIVCYSFSIISFVSGYIYKPFVYFWNFVWVFWYERVI